MIKQKTYAARMFANGSPFVGDLLSISDRWRYGMKTMEYSSSQTSEMPKVDKFYTNGYELFLLMSESKFYTWYHLNVGLPSTR